MAGNSAFRTVNERGWRAGLWNLARKENRDWWSTRTWLIQSLVWLVILNGLTLGVVLMSSDPQILAEADPATAALLADKTTVPLDKFFQIAGMALALGVVVLAQDEIIGERRSGTAAWVLSKPVSRSGLVLSKLLGNMPGILLVMVMLPGIVTYLMVSVYRGSPLPVVGFLLGLAALFLYLLVFLALTIMLGIISSSRGLMLGVPLVIILGFQIYMMFLSPLYDFLPQALTQDEGGKESVSLALEMGHPLPSFVPIVANVAWIVSFAAISIWRFNKEEL